MSPAAVRATDGRLAATDDERSARRGAIVEAAFAVFASKGYAQASIQDIADAAQVAKPTVYNYLRDKQALLRAAVIDAADRIARANHEAIEALRTTTPQTLRHDLESTVTALLEICAGPDSQALRCLVLGQAPLFPTLPAEVQARTYAALRDGLSDRLAHLCVRGALTRCDPDTAAAQLLGLIVGHALSVHSADGMSSATDGLGKTAAATTELFLRAYGSQERNTA